MVEPIKEPLRVQTYTTLVDLSGVNTEDISQKINEAIADVQKESVDRCYTLVKIEVVPLMENVLLVMTVE